MKWAILLFSSGFYINFRPRKRSLNTSFAIQLKNFLHCFRLIDNQLFKVKSRFIFPSSHLQPIFSLPLPNSVILSNAKNLKTYTKIICLRTYSPKPANTKPNQHRDFAKPQCGFANHQCGFVKPH